MKLLLLSVFLYSSMAFSGCFDYTGHWQASWDENGDKQNLPETWHIVQSGCEQFIFTVVGRGSIEKVGFVNSQKAIVGDKTVAVTNKLLPAGLKARYTLKAEWGAEDEDLTVSSRLRAGYLFALLGLVKTTMVLDPMNENEMEMTVIDRSWAFTQGKDLVQKAHLTRVQE